MPINKADLKYWIILFIAVVAGIWLLKEYGFIASAVVFEDYLEYDDRINSPMLYEDNYVGYNVNAFFTNMGGYLSDPNNPQCKSNTCNGVENGLDGYGCMTYVGTTTEQQNKDTKTECAGIRSSTRDAPCIKLYGSNYYCRTFGSNSASGVCSTKVTVTVPLYCGGATEGNCNGDDCYGMGNCNDDEDDSGTWHLTEPVVTLTDWKNQYDGHPLGVTIVSGGGTNGAECRGQWCQTHKEAYYEDNLWILDMKATTTKGHDECGTSSLVLPTASQPYKITGQSSSQPNFLLTSTDVQLKTKKSLKGYDLKINYECTGSANVRSYTSGALHTYQGTCTVIIGDDTSKKSYTITSPDTQLIEVFSSKLTPGLVDIYIDGLFKETVTFTGEVYVTFVAGNNNGALDIKYFGYRVPFACNQGPEELLGVETFSGPRSLSITDLRYAPTKFCLDHPVIITSSTQQGSTATAEVYQKLRQGEVMNIPLDQTWTVFYIFYNDGSLPAVCPEGQFDITRNKCTNLTGIVQFCSEGTFDPFLGACVVTPEQKFVCEYGRYDVAQDRCIYNPPVQAVCEVGDYNSVTGKCEYKPQGTIICEEGYTYNELTKFCESFPQAVIVCDPTFSFNTITGYCEKSVPTEYLCDGDWDATTKTCTKTVIPNIDRVCPSDSYLFQDDRGNYACIYEPDLTPECTIGQYDSSLDKCVYIPSTEAECGTDTYDSSRDICIHEPDREIFCPQGSFDTTKNACVITPDISYLCINGELADDKSSCVIVPRTRVICPSGTTYDIDSEVCIEEGDLEILCPEGSVYSSSREKCVSSPEEVIICPEGSEYNTEKGICEKELLTTVIETTKIKQPLSFIAGILIVLIIGFFVLSQPKK